MLNWARATVATMTTVPASSTIIAAAVVLSNPGISETVRRTRGRIWVQSDQSAAVENQIAALGFMVVTDTAFALGITAVPNPVDEASDDGWFVWLPLCQTSSLAADGGPTGYGYDFDSKAMRKVEEGFTVVAVIANKSASNGLQFNLMFSLLSSRT